MARINPRNVEIRKRLDAAGPGLPPEDFFDFPADRTGIAGSRKRWLATGKSTDPQRERMRTAPGDIASTKLSTGLM